MAMATATASAACIIPGTTRNSLFPSSSLNIPSQHIGLPLPSSMARIRRCSLRSSSKCFSVKEELSQPFSQIDDDEELELRDNSVFFLHSFSPLPLLLAASLLPGGILIVKLFLLIQRLIWLRLQIFGLPKMWCLCILL